MDYYNDKSSTFNTHKKNSIKNQAVPSNKKLIPIVKNNIPYSFAVKV